MTEQDELTALRTEVGLLRTEVARLRSQQAAHVCAVPPQPVWQKTFPAAGAAGGALPLTFIFNQKPESPYEIVWANTACAAPPPATYMVNLAG